MYYTHNAESADNGGGGSASGLSTTATIIIIAAVAVGVVIVIIIIVLVVVLRRRNNRNKGQAARRGVKQNTYAERVVFKNERRSPMPEPRRNGNATVNQSLRSKVRPHNISERHCCLGFQKEILRVIKTCRAICLYVRIIKICFGFLKSMFRI